MPTATKTFVYTGAAEEFVVPAVGADVIHIECWGAQGKASDFYAGGKGGYATGTLAVTAGESLRVTVGGTPSAAGAGGFNGGGLSEGGGAGGGGGSDVRQGGTALADRVIIAGGGGGAGESNGGGQGGGTSGADGSGPAAGGGGTQVAGGAAGGGDASAGALGQGGAADGSLAAGGGGGGYYGGGGGGINVTRGAPGGGGSGYTGGVTSASMESGVREGNGVIVITYEDTRATLTPTVAVAVHSSGAAFDISATHPEVTDPNTEVETVSIAVQRQQQHPVTGAWGDEYDVAGGYNTVARGLDPDATYADWLKITSKRKYRWRILSTGANGTTAVSEWSEEATDPAPSGGVGYGGGY